LPLQECLGVRPRDPQNRQRGQIANDRGISRGNQLGGWSAERGYTAAVEACAMRGEVIGPGWIHRGHLVYFPPGGLPAGHTTAPALALAEADKSVLKSNVSLDWQFSNPGRYRKRGVRRGLDPGNSQIRTIRVPVVPSTRAQSRIEAQP
jgi:hypothetical protein